MIQCDYWKFPWMFMCLLCDNVGNFFKWPWDICAM